MHNRLMSEWRFWRGSDALDVDARFQTASSCLLWMGTAAATVSSTQLAEIGSSCFTKCDLILCKSDYIRLFGHPAACRACSKSIPANEIVMRAQGNVFHVKWFVCSVCQNQLVPGDRFHYTDGKLYCERDKPTASAYRNDHLNSLREHNISEQKKETLIEHLVSYSKPNITQ